VVARARAVAAVTVLLCFLAAVLDIIDLSATNTFAAVGELVFPIVGLVIARSQPRNTVAWTFLVSGLLNAINLAGQAVSDVGLRHDWPEGVQFFGAWCTGWTWFPALFVIITIGLLHFPNGMPVSSRWRWADRAAVATMVLWIVCVGVAVWGLPVTELQSSAAPHPHGWRAVVWAGTSVAFLAIVPLVLIAVASLVVRWRRSNPVEKTQIRWVVAAGAVAVIAEITIDVLPELGVPVSGVAQTLVESSAFGLIAVATGFAILRHRLYEIDRIISRTVGYAVVTALLAAVYLCIVATAGAIIPPAYGSVGVAAATLAVAALFVPLRRRIQHAVDRRFNRARYDAGRTINMFAAAVRIELSQAELTAQLLQTVESALAPASSSLWLASSAIRPSTRSAS
jgi:hypothetical protein